jgi:hypothetical protein
MQILLITVFTFSLLIVVWHEIVEVYSFIFEVVI